MNRYKLICIALLLVGCSVNSGRQLTSKEVLYQSKPISDFWKSATIYFLLTDRFYNGDPENDLQYNRKHDGAVLRNFEGGDIAGITQKIQEGYFDSLGVNAIWLTPVFEQIRSHTDEGTGKTYAYHGYWTRDWTFLDPNFGTEEELATMVDIAHMHGIRILLDAVVNHTGPVTNVDTQWPDDWVRTGPKCVYKDYKSTVECTLVDNLPDIRTDAKKEVQLPPFLLEKWRSEGRYDKNVKELDQYFRRTGYPRVPHQYIIKWLVDWVRKYGIDGFRIDTTKHTEGYVWSILKRECDKALASWKQEHPEKKIDDLGFYMVGEVYGYGISGGRTFDYGDQKVDFFDFGYESLINFEFKYDARSTYDSIFVKYANLLQTKGMTGQSVLNYLTSHDDGSPFDPKRKNCFDAATKLLLCPGAAQIYYGDELARPLIIDGAEGDANLRSNMNWKDLDKSETKALLSHWQKLGRFRSSHQAVGAGTHHVLQTKPYIFRRALPSVEESSVVIGLGLSKGNKVITLGDTFEEGLILRDYYSNTDVTVISGKATLSSPYDIVLLGKKK